MIKGIKFASIPVRNQDKSLEFYTQKLGLKVITDSPFDGTQRWIELGMPRAETKLVLFTADGQDKMIGGFMNVTFMADDVEATAKELKARGVEFVQEAAESRLGHRRHLQGHRRQRFCPLDAVAPPVPYSGPGDEHGRSDRHAATVHGALRGHRPRHARSRPASSGRACRTPARRRSRWRWSTDAMKLSGLEFTEAELKSDGRRRQPEPHALRGAARRSTSPTTCRRRFISARSCPGIEVNRTKLPFRLSAAPAVKRPANLEDVAFWPVRHLAELAAHEAGHLGRAHRDVSGAPAPLQRQAEQRRHLPRRRRAWPRRSARTRRSRPASTKGRCTAFRGARRTSSRSRATRPRGDRRRSRISRSTTTPASSKCCATRAPC